MNLPSDETELSTKDSPANFERKLGFKGKSLNTRESDTAKEEGIGTVSGPAVGMAANNHNKDKEEVMVMTNESEKGEFDYKNMEDEKAIKDEGLNGDDGLGFGQHNESFVEDDHPRDEGGQFTSGSGGSSDSGSSDSGSSDNEEWGGNPDTNPFKDDNIKDIIKSIKGEVRIGKIGSLLNIYQKWQK